MPSECRGFLNITGCGSSGVGIESSIAEGLIGFSLGCFCQTLSVLHHLSWLFH